MELPRWVELLTALGLGGIAKPIFNLILFKEKKKADRESGLWMEIGKLQAGRIEADRKMDLMMQNYEAEISHIRDQKHIAQNEAVKLQMEVLVLKMEVNDELKKQGLPARYNLREEQGTKVIELPAGPVQ